MRAKAPNHLVGFVKGDTMSTVDRVVSDSRGRNYRRELLRRNGVRSREHFIFMEDME